VKQPADTQNGALTQAGHWVTNRDRGRRLGSFFATRSAVLTLGNLVESGVIDHLLDHLVGADEY
jgi:hypothetical protein